MAIFTLVAIALAATGCSSSKSSRKTIDFPSSTENRELTQAGVQLTIPQTIQFAYDAGFHTEEQLVTVVAIGVAEGSLWTQFRHWHPEYGYRPARDVIGVQGPDYAWNSSHTQQVHSDRGVWQISTHWWGKYSDARSDDPAQAAKVVWEMSKGGTDYRPWDSWYKSKKAQQHYDEAFEGWPPVRPEVRQFLAEHGVK